MRTSPSRTGINIILMYMDWTEEEEKWLPMELTIEDEYGLYILMDNDRLGSLYEECTGTRIHFFEDLQNGRIYYGVGQGQKYSHKDFHQADDAEVPGEVDQTDGQTGDEFHDEYAEIQDLFHDDYAECRDKYKAEFAEFLDNVSDDYKKIWDEVHHDCADTLSHCDYAEQLNKLQHAYARDLDKLHCDYAENLRKVHHAYTGQVHHASAEALDKVHNTSMQLLDKLHNTSMHILDMRHHSSTWRLDKKLREYKAHVKRTFERRVVDFVAAEKGVKTKDVQLVPEIRDVKDPAEDPATSILAEDVFHAVMRISKDRETEWWVVSYQPSVEGFGSVLQRLGEVARLEQCAKDPTSCPGLEVMSGGSIKAAFCAVHFDMPSDAFEELKRRCEVYQVALLRRLPRGSIVKASAAGPSFMTRLRHAPAALPRRHAPLHMHRPHAAMACATRHAAQLAALRKIV